MPGQSAALSQAPWAASLASRPLSARWGPPKARLNMLPRSARMPDDGPERNYNVARHDLRTTGVEPLEGALMGIFSSKFVVKEHVIRSLDNARQQPTENREACLESSHRCRLRNGFITPSMLSSEEQSEMNVSSRLPHAEWVGSADSEYTLGTLDQHTSRRCQYSWQSMRGRHPTTPQHLHHIARSPRPPRPPPS